MIFLGIQIHSTRISLAICLETTSSSSWIWRDDAAALVGQGNTISYWVKMFDSGRAYCGFGASASGTYSLTMAPNTNQLIIMLNSGWSYSDLATVSQTYTFDKWYRLKIQWDIGGVIIGRLYDSDGMTLLNTVTTTDTTYTQGGIAMRGFNNVYRDTIERCGPVPADLRTPSSESSAISVEPRDPADAIGWDEDNMAYIYEEPENNAAGAMQSDLDVYDVYMLTDEFDYWEDQSTHSYTTTGYTTQGAYVCDGTDDSLRIGSCSQASVSSAQITVSVEPGADQLKLRYKVPWSNTGSALYIDGVAQGTITGNNCDWQEKILTGMSSYTADGSVDIKIADEILSSCAGNIQITYIEVYSYVAYILTDEFDYWEDQSSHSYTTTGYTGQGAYVCGGTDDSLRIGTCSQASVSSAQITASVVPGADQLKLRYKVPWWNTGSVLYIDGVVQGTMIGNGCNWQETILTGMSGYTQDGAIDIKIADEVPNSCSGDIQITYIEVYSYMPECQLTYDVYLGEDPDALSLICPDVFSKECDPYPNLSECGKEYFWKVVAKNCCGETESPIWSFTTEYLLGDFDLNCNLDYLDFAVMAYQWQQVPGVPSADIAPPGGDNFVDMQDAKVFAGNWLDEITP